METLRLVGVILLFLMLPFGTVYIFKHYPSKKEKYNDSVRSARNQNELIGRRKK